MKGFLHNLFRASVAPGIPLVLALALTCCGPGDRVEITDESTYSEHRQPPALDVPSTGRFGGVQPAAMASTGGPGASSGFHFHWEKPAGWQELAPTEFRTANFSFGPNGVGECYLSLSGGSLFDNANRWRGQMGLDSYSQEDFDALERFPILGEQAAILRLQGSYTGMGSNPRPGYHLLGMMLRLGDTGVFVKMVGPTELIQSEVNNFVVFISSLQAEADGAHGEETVAAAAGVDLPADHPSIGSPPDPTATAGTGGGPGSAQGYAWEAPEGWLRGPDRSMRLATYRVGQSSEGYVSLLGGEAGGELANINRWLGQFGEPGVSQSELDAMPRVLVLGKEVAFLEVSGTSTNMQGVATPGQTMLGVAYSSPSGSLFIRLTGPSGEVAGQRAAFLAFCASFTPGP